MKAIQVESFGDPDVLAYNDVEDPEAGPGQVLVDVRAAGVNPVDTYIRTGEYAMKPDRPYIPGSDAAGVVQSVGDGVESVSVGDRVYTSETLTGAYAELTLCEESMVHPLPDATDFEQGAALGVPYPTAYRALFHRGRPVFGETILVHGATGGVGTAAVQMAHASGLHVLATGGSEEGRELATGQGADVVFDHHAEDHFQRILDETGGRGVDIILEMLANVNLGEDLEILAPFGRVVVVGSRGTVEIDPRNTMGRDADVRGMSLFNVPENEMQQIHRALYVGLSRGWLDPVIGSTVPLAEASRAHRAVMSRGHTGKIVLVPES